MNIKALGILVIITVSLAKCTKRETIPCNTTIYSFSVTCEYLNNKENYQVGDTIKIVSEFPTRLIDLQTGNAIDYSNAVAIACSFGTGLLDSVNNRALPAIDSFTYVATKGEVRNPATAGANSRSFFYEESNGMYRYEILVILKKKGRYVIGVNNGSSSGIRNKNCTNAAFYVQGMSVDKNLQILLNTGIPDTKLTQEVIDHSFCFRVL